MARISGIDVSCKHVQMNSFLCALNGLVMVVHHHHTMHDVCDRSQHAIHCIAQERREVTTGQDMCS